MAWLRGFTANLARRSGSPRRHSRGARRCHRIPATGFSVAVACATVNSCSQCPATPGPLSCRPRFSRHWPSIRKIARAAATRQPRPVPHPIRLATWRFVSCTGSPMAVSSWTRHCVVALPMRPYNPCCALGYGPTKWKIERGTRCSARIGWTCYCLGSHKPCATSPVNFKRPALDAITQRIGR